MHLPDVIYKQKAIICCAIGFIAGLITDRSPLLIAAQVILLVAAAVITQLRRPYAASNSTSTKRSR
ncbi:hypothetical protein PG1C_05555 [Rugosibacter aromaticivorans]|uniref:Uncharacterized protein n=1 Tax=Rugosibacter aromaticivorans TaxID=1565605 RepID=A0A0C5JL29_9PROT|nr:hypothetical protein [Rugosibacter aromaticivorans]AJP48071.1 hypothetical protein PG1C_05555 [Rugosibacter aromaticivorans]TBR13562.1 MAG: hypothetical protein EPO43_10310 [Rugosibacter sp.]